MKRKKAAPKDGFSVYHVRRDMVAEDEGFEPPWAFTQMVFKTTAL